MDFLGNIDCNAKSASGDSALYRALLAGDLPFAWLVGKDMEECTEPASEFNCGLCLFLLEEYEKALMHLKKAEKLLSNPPEFDIDYKMLFIKAVEIKDKSGGAIWLLPLDPDSSVSRTRYGLIRIRRLMADCLLKLGRKGEAAPIIRFLSQYNISVF